MSAKGARRNCAARSPGQRWNEPFPRPTLLPPRRAPPKLPASRGSARELPCGRFRKDHTAVALRRGRSWLTAAESSWRPNRGALGISGAARMRGGARQIAARARPAVVVRGPARSWRTRLPLQWIDDRILRVDPSAGFCAQGAMGGRCKPAAPRRRQAAAGRDCSRRGKLYNRSEFCMQNAESARITPPFPR